MTMRPSILALIATVIAIAAAPALVPHPLEQVTMLIRDKKYETALEVADRFVDEGETRPELLMEVFVLHERFGDLAKAKAALRRYLSLRPDDVEGWRKAAWVYANAHRAEPLMEALENVVRLTHDREAVDSLARLYRLHARFEDEIRILASVEPMALTTQQVMRRAELHIAGKEYAAAIEVLRYLDARLPPEQKTGRLLFFDVLVAQGIYDEAVARSRYWLNIWNSADDRATFVRHLLRAGASEQAIALAAEADASRENQVLVYLLDILTLEARLDLLDGLVGAWIRHADQLSPAGAEVQIGEAVAVAAERGLQPTLFEQLYRTLSRDDHQEMAAALVEALLDQFGQIAIMPYRAMFQPKLLAARPVMSARLLLAEGNFQASRQYLLSADLKALSSRSCANWLAVAQVVLNKRELMDILAMHARSGDLPACLVMPEKPIAASNGASGLMQTLVIGEEPSLAARL